MAFKLNSVEEYESVGTFKFSQFPKARAAKIEELLEEGLYDTREEAEAAVDEMEFELELYYEKGTGAFAVETDAVESGTIYSPYTRELGDKADED